MRTVEEVRRDRLEMLITEVGSKAKLNQMTGKSERDSTYSQIANRSKGSKTGKAKEMGSAMARALEDACNKPRGWMDTDPRYDGWQPDGGVINADPSPSPKPIWPFTRIRESDIHALDPVEVGRLEGIIATGIKQLQIPLKVAPVPEQPRGSVARDDVELPFGMQPLVAPPVPRPTVAPASDVDLPFAPAPREVMPWEAHRFPQASAAAPAALISRESDVIGNVAAGAHASNDEFEAVPELAEVKLAAGIEGMEVLNEAATGELHFRSSFLRRHGADNGRARVVYADGDSMEPVIQHGAALLVVPSKGLTWRDVASGGVWAINYGGKLLVKSIVKLPAGMWVARSFNAKYGDIMLETDAEVRVIGQVVWAGGTLRDDIKGRWARV